MCVCVYIRKYQTLKVKFTSTADSSSEDSCTSPCVLSAFSLIDLFLGSLTTRGGDRPRLGDGYEHRIAFKPLPINTTVYYYTAG